MATISQINANRGNALKSTGPKSPAGKARASRNAICHGFTSKQIVLNTENEADFQGLHAEFVKEYQPSSPTECMLVDEVAVAAWRLRRMQSLETVLLDFRLVLERGFFDPETRSKFDPQHPSWTRYRQVEAWRTTDAFEQLSRYESRARSAFYRALAELRRHKVQSQDREETVPGTAAKPLEIVRRTQSVSIKSKTCSQIGFVLPTPQHPTLVPEPTASGPCKSAGRPPDTQGPDPSWRITRTPVGG